MSIDNRNLNNLDHKNYGDDYAGWSDIANQLCKLRIAMEYAQEFPKKISRFISKEDKIEMAGLNAKYDAMYWKYWQKLVKGIRGF